MPHDPYGDLKAEATALLADAVRRLGADAPVRLGAAPAGKGDWAFACFPLAKAARKAPAQIAADLVAAIPASPRLTFVAEGPYVNVSVEGAALVRETVRAVEADGDAFGRRPPRGVKVILEHTSANPNGPFHVGRARNPIVGDTLARILAAAGYEVLTEYYVNDMGKQVAILAWGLANLKPTDVAEPERDKVDHQLVVYYQEANKRLENDPAVDRAVSDSLRRFEGGDPEAARAFRDAASRVLDGMKQSLARLHVEHRSWKWESEYVESGAVNEIVAQLQKAPQARREEAPEAGGEAWVLDLAEFGIPGRTSRLVFVRADGTTLYGTRDLAYHMDKFRRADRLVNILGEDHKLTMQQLAIGLNLLGEKRAPETLFYAFVSLPEGKMSTRRGRVVYIDDLLDEAHARAYEEVKKRRAEELSEDEMRRIAEIVGIGALRFNIASVQAEKGIVFRWEDALAFEGSTAPFVQYAHARAAGILANAEAAAPPDLAALTHPSEVALARQVARLPQVVEEAAEGFRIHMVAAYAVELANAFNEFYRDCPVSRAPPGLREGRLALVRAGKAALRNTLELLGIVAPDSM